MLNLFQLIPMKHLFSSLTLLIVDDDADDRQLFFEAAAETEKDCQCLAADNGEEALALLHAADAALPDFIFLDLNMPRMGGQKFLQELRKQKKFDHIRVIVYSTSNRPEAIAEMRQLGADAFITKPNSFDEIRTTISRAIVSMRLQQSM